MSGTVAGLAGQLRSGLAGVLGSLGPLDPAQRRAKLAEALGLPGARLTPSTLLSRLGAPDADQAGDLWPRLLALLAAAADDVVPSWSLTVPEVLTATADDVRVLATALPPEVAFVVNLGTLRLADVLRVRQDITLTLTVPSDPAGAALRLSVRGVQLTLPGDDLLTLLVPGGLALEGDLQARFDAQGVRFEGGGRTGSPSRCAAPPGLRAPARPRPALAGRRRPRYTVRAARAGAADGVGLEPTGRRTGGQPFPGPRPAGPAGRRPAAPAARTAPHHRRVPEYECLVHSEGAPSPGIHEGTR
ncbi:hypothetical protein [Streptomyces cupreus]|uniref:Uncharacterized protein n=1 Tax=Streptomyces cupreus TaxID=2759956 RepID=A0A7X1IXJ1_9ACTN|nr:hypothetical protein [Streptomyces cupreus]MBC2900239.1 hypothetical protein [Streptomyces cupreus]